MFNSQCFLNNYEENRPLSSIQLKTTSSGLHITKDSFRNVLSFNKGDECLLWLPNFLCEELPECSYLDLLTAFKCLKIKWSECSPSQLQCLKQLNLLSEDDDYSLLITVPDAHRLCRMFARESLSCQNLPFQLKIGHNYLGHCRGLFMLPLHLGQNSPCIKCEECHEIMHPKEFVVHCHEKESDSVCKQDIDIDRWWKYIHPNERLKSRFLTMRLLNELKYKFLDYTPMLPLRNIFDKKANQPLHYSNVQTHLFQQ